MTERSQSRTVSSADALDESVLAREVKEKIRGRPKERRWWGKESE